MSKLRRLAMKNTMQIVAAIGFVVGGILLLCAPEPVQVGKAHSVRVPNVADRAVSGARTIL